MANSDFSTLLSGSGTVNRSGLLTALEKRGAYVIDAAENPQALNAGNILTIIFSGIIFWYDPADATTAHDGVSCLVTAEGRRYKADQINGISARIVAVIDQNLATPPVSPTLGDKYIVAASGTGAWAAKDEQFAIYTARGWVFQVPNIWDIAYVVDEVLFYHYNAAGNWTSGLPALTIANTSLSLRKLKYFQLGVSVENQTTNTPPGSPADGVAYVVAGSPTGAWVGHSLDVAVYETSEWVFYDPYEGARIYDKSLDAAYNFNGATWVASVSGYSQISHVFTAAVENSANLTDVAYSATVAPTTASSNHADGVTLAHTAKAAGKRLEINYNCVMSVNDTSGVTVIESAIIAIQVDSTVSMSDWKVVGLLNTTAGSVTFVSCNVNFSLSAADASSHTYRIRIFLNHDSGGTVDVDISRREITIREVA